MGLCDEVLVAWCVVSLILEEHGGYCQTGDSVRDQVTRRYDKANDMNNFIVKAIFDGNGFASDLEVQERLLEEELKDRQMQFNLIRSKLINRKDQDSPSGIISSSNESPPSVGKNDTGVYIQVGDKLVKLSEDFDERLNMLERSKQRPDKLSSI